jgi:hypothetical protein
MLGFTALRVAPRRFAVGQLAEGLTAPLSVQT